MVQRQNLPLGKIKKRFHNGFSFGCLREMPVIIIFSIRKMVMFYISIILREFENQPAQNDDH